MNVNAGGREPHDADLIAPWRAVDRLDAEDARVFERLLQDDPETVRRLDAALEERDATIDLNEALPSPSPATRDALFARIEAERTRSASAKLAGAGRWFAGRLAALSPVTLAWTATAAALVIAIQAGLLATGYLTKDRGGFVTASDGRAAAPTGQTALIGFQPTATAGDIAALLADVRAEIVAGPKPGGVFVVRLGDKALTDAELAATLDVVRKRTEVVRFAAPGAAAPGR